VDWTAYRHFINTGLGHNLLLRPPLRGVRQTIAKTLEDRPHILLRTTLISASPLQAAGDLSGAITEYEKAKQLGRQYICVDAVRSGQNLRWRQGCRAANADDLDKISQQREVLATARAALSQSEQ